MNATSKKRLHRGLLGAAALTALALGWEHVSFLRQIETKTLDYRYKNFNRDTKASDRVITFLIDDAALKLVGESYGRWPWPRRVYKDLIDTLTSQSEPSGIFFDLMFFELQANSNDDKELAEISATRKNIFHAADVSETSSNILENKTHEPLPELFKQGSQKRWNWKIDPSVQNFPHVTLLREAHLPPEPYLKQGVGLHLVNAEKDPDGVTRKAPLLKFYDDTWFPSLSLAAVISSFASNDTPTLSYTTGWLQLESPSGRVLRIPVDENGLFRLHYYKLENDAKSLPIAPMVEAARLAQGAVSQITPQLEDAMKLLGDLKDKLILIGTSAQGLYDLKVTPVLQVYPGVSTHGTAISNILNQDFLSRAPLFLRLFHALLLGFATYACVLFFESLAAKLLAPTALALAGIALAFLLFQSHSIWIDIALPTTLFVLALVDSLSYLSFVEGRDKKKIQDTLGKYLPPSIISEMIANGTDLRAEVGKKKELSILFSDIRGFTTLSEQMAPEKVVGILNEYLGKMTDLVFVNMGTLDKFIGDAVMAFWGAPLNDNQHAVRSVSTAIQMQVTLAEMRAEWAKRPEMDGVHLQIGIGVNTGEVIVGNIGSERKLDYTVIGDNVNTASRFEGLTKYYGVGVVIGERTHELVKDQIHCRTVDKVKPKGKNQAVKIFEPIATKGMAGESEIMTHIDSFEKAWKLYDEGSFSKALELFKKCLAERSSGDGLCELYIERCEEFMNSPPSSPWDGVYVAKSK